uniref:Uncharacterized protein n=1 Tax=Psilocybe cubensis TaxID=181762 RepID=A0A8H7XN01_PSICU
MTALNITFDDALNSTSFLFQPSECNGSGWTVHKGEGYLGTYSSCTSSEGPSAGISFQGVAVYYRSAYINGSSVRFKLDGALSEDIDLSPPVGKAVNKNATNIFWSRTGLNNTSHLLEIVPGSKNSTTLSVDAFTVTQLVGNNGTSTNPGGSFASSLAGGAAAALAPKTTPSQTRFALGFGITFAIVSFSVFLFICVSLGRRRRLMKASYGRSKPVPPIRPTSTMFSQHATVRSQVDGGVGTHHDLNSPAHSPKIEDLDEAYAMDSIPSLAHGSVVANDDDDAATERRWGSPTPSNRNLLSHGTSYGQVDHSQPLSRKTTTSTARLEPLRQGSPALSRNTTTSTTRLEPLRNTVDYPSSLSRNTTTSTTRFEPVRKVRAS